MKSKIDLLLVMISLAISSKENLINVYDEQNNIFYFNSQYQHLFNCFYTDWSYGIYNVVGQFNTVENSNYQVIGLKLQDITELTQKLLNAYKLDRKKFDEFITIGDLLIILDFDTNGLTILLAETILNETVRFSFKDISSGKISEILESQMIESLKFIATITNYNYQVGYKVNTVFNQYLAEKSKPTLDLIENLQTIKNKISENRKLEES
jgi:hypothetical protein